jgi:hypothetical protein
VYRRPIPERGDPWKLKLFVSSSEVSSTMAVCRTTACRDSEGGVGSGEQRDVCDMLITKEQLVLEGIPSTLSDRPKDMKPVQFHVKCFYAGDAERRAPKT